MKILQILNNIDRRIIYLLVSIAVIVPMLVNVKMPIVPDTYAKTAFNAISEKFSSPDSDNGKVKKILLSFDFGPSTEPELGPMAFSIMKQVLLTGNEVHLMALFDTGIAMMRKTKNKIYDNAPIVREELNNKIFDLGYAPGGEAVIKGMLSDIPTIFPNARGKADNLCDYDFIVSFSAGDPGSKQWVQFAGDLSKVACDGKRIDITAGVTAVQVTELLPYVNTNQLKGILAGLAGAASYESLTGDYGPASEKMAPQSFVHLVIVLLIIIGNITYFVNNKKKVE